MQNNTDTSPDRTNNHRASIRDDIQSFTVLINASQERLQCLRDFSADALILVYLVGKLDFLEQLLGNRCSLEQVLLNW